MSDHDVTAPGGRPSEPPTGPSVGDDEISLEPLFQLFWAYRRVLVAAACGFAVLFALSALRMYFAQPVERHAALEFRLLFEGATRGAYPNDLPFAPSEIVAGPVLSRVFTAHALDRYMSFDTFQRRIAVLEMPDPALELLARDFQRQLEQSLPLAERVRREEEYRQKRDALRQPLYTLSFISPAGEGDQPPVLTNEVLEDVLAVWAEDAIERLHVLEYEIEVLSPETLVPDFVADQHPFVRLDVLRGRLNRIVASLDRLAMLPGASSMTAGEEHDGVTLTALRGYLQDLQQIRLRPLVMAMLASASATDRQLIAGYLESCLLQNRLDQRQAAALVDVQRDILRSYMSFDRTFERPQTAVVTDPLLDRLLLLSVEATDLPFRRHIVDRVILSAEHAARLEKEVADYEEMLAWLQGDRPRPAVAGVTADARTVPARVEAIQTDIVRTLGQATALRAAISARNLSSGAGLYSIVAPFSVREERASVVRPLAAYGILLLIVWATLVPLACITHFWLWRLRGRQATSRPTQPHSPGGSSRLEPAPPDRV